ncbi:non-canonical purine NTP pyrophosphatase [Pajaroellobacter abortibovis]|uniref:dITP/XTP pyrophosphatase n=1 Tax=Pajaroellobacter abortibovis TaxID=1882918 RepID=A0A1L6MYR8_9BACT|nr:non-canonical purine NTP pyrophosphatase [Pajaroellobacter abortibovis]APS00565.1 hypothetical protein BCY86_07680 [Pajaroellobacter abortibovis]
MSLTLLVASSNQHKLREFNHIFAQLPLTLLPFTEHPSTHSLIVEEKENTFSENAIQKARLIAEKGQIITLADDSGLEVDALDGKPGVRSARFAHEHASDAENRLTLWTALSAKCPSSLPSNFFPARFRCVLAIVDPASPHTPHIFEGACEGHVTLTPSGTHGFGYDPMFTPLGAEQTFAELSLTQKMKLSHRGAALQRLIPWLQSYVLSHS